MAETSISELDLYELFNIEISSTTSDIRKAYRKKALQCHPDKNPDDPEASKKFQLLIKALEVLTDEAARTAYDRVLRRRKEAEIRFKQLGSKRQKLKEDLEAREKNALNKNQRQKTDDEKLQEEIQRLNKEGSKLVEEEIENILKATLDEKKNKRKYNDNDTKVTVKWKADKNDPENGGYTSTILSNFLSKYGKINLIIMSPKKKGSALVEFNDVAAAEMAIAIEIGLPANPLKLEWVSEARKLNPNKLRQQSSSLLKPTDFESVTLMKLRQAEERKRIIEQMMAEDQE